MPSFMDMISEPTPRKRRVLLYGTHGIGKSTFANCAPNPIFIQNEDGLQDIEGVRTFPLCRSFADVMQQISELLRQPHDFKTLAVDSIDWAEKLIHQYICESESKKSVADLGFGKGYELAANLFGEMLSLLGELNVQRNMMIILLAHCQIDRYESPVTDAYDRYSPKVHKKINGTLQEWCDEVLFANYKVYTRSEEKSGFSKERKLGVGSGERVIYTCERPGYLAKNRIADCPAEIPLAFSSYWELIKPKTSTVKNIEAEEEVAA